MLTIVPFSGFYNSWHDAELDDRLRMMFSDRASGNDEDCHGLQDRAYDACNWGDVHRAYAEEFCSTFADLVGVAVEFESMTSPREYNFTTDRIFATVSEEEARRWLAVVKGAELDEVARDTFTSRSGFSSFYSPDVEDWGDLSTWDHNQVGALLAAYVGHKATEEGWAEDDPSDLDIRIACRMSENGHADNALCEGGPAFMRLVNIHDYLELRAERA